jgi:hypothetical protein
MCKDTESSVVVTVTDTCPCQYQNNYYSNKRWCCGDMVSKPACCCDSAKVPAVRAVVVDLRSQVKVVLAQYPGIQPGLAHAVPSGIAGSVPECAVG